MKTVYLIIATLIFSACADRKSKRTGLEGQTIPSFAVQLIDSTQFYNTAEIKPGKDFVLFYYSPKCPYCKAQINEFISHIDRLKDIPILMVTNFPFEEMKNFYTGYKLNQYPNIIAGRDTGFFISNYFETHAVPLTAIYGKDKKLQEVFTGQVFSKEIKKAIDD